MIAECTDAAELAVGIGRVLQHGMDGAGIFETELRSRLADLRTRLRAVVGGEDPYSAILAAATVQGSADVLANVALPEDDDVAGTRNRVSCNARAMDLLSRFPVMASESSATWARRLGCSETRVRNLPAWKKCRDHVRSAGSRRAVSIAQDDDVAVGESNEILKRLIRDQAADEASDRVRSGQRL
ncbi:MAG: hypothetical protein AMXMBFR58_24470 [Phycisphaerae bacterium]